MSKNPNQPEIIAPGTPAYEALEQRLAAAGDPRFNPAQQQAAREELHVNALLKEGVAAHKAAEYRRTSVKWEVAQIANTVGVLGAWAAGMVDIFIAPSETLLTTDGSAAVIAAAGAYACRAMSRRYTRKAAQAWPPKK